VSVHERRKPPSGHGEILSVPPFDEWAALARRNAERAATWPEALAGLRAQAREETLAEARRFSAELGIPPAEGRDNDLIIMTGHQPELYHPGVWVKNFLVERLSSQMGATGVDLVVDTDACEHLVLRVPRMDGGVAVHEVPLTPVGEESAYVQTRVPDAAARAAFRAEGLEALATLPAPALSRHFRAFCDALDDVAASVSDTGALMTAARRRYEGPTSAVYLEVQLSRQAQLPAYQAFAASLLADAARFRKAMNEALAAFRARTGTRSQAQPFPDLGVQGDRIEVPFWRLAEGRRQSVSVSSDGVLYADDNPIAELGPTAESARAALAHSGLLLAPKALALTLFERLFVADLFVHGTGGGRYDQVTDAVIAAYYGVEPPAFVVASMTLLLPLGACVVSDEDVASAEHRLHRFQHNPDSILPDVEFDTTAERARADDLSRRKAEAVVAIAVEGADRKALGRSIRELNAELTELLAPVGRELTSALERVRAKRAASAVLTDRTYPYCLWDPLEVVDKVR